MEKGKILEHLASVKYELKKLMESALSEERKEGLEKDIEAIKEAEGIISIVLKN